MNGAALSPVRILVTGFGPFPGVPFNASEFVVNALEGSSTCPGILLSKKTVPVTWAEARRVAQDAIEQVKPHAVLHFGVSKRLTGFEIETRAVNIGGPKEDSAGVVWPAAPLDRTGKPFLDSTLPATPLLMALRQQGLPAQLSKDAGRYLCNALLFWSCADAGEAGPLVGFIHMPAIGAAPEAPSRLSLEQACSGAQVLVRATAQAVIRARMNGNGIREGKSGNGSQAFHGGRRSVGRAVWHRGG